MRNYEFVVWLEGYFDFCGERPFTLQMLQIIKNHLNLVSVADSKLGEFNQAMYDLISPALEQRIDAAALGILRGEIFSRLSVFLAGVQEKMAAAHAG